MLKRTLVLITLFASLLITACGFQLRGSENLPPQLKTLFVDSKTPYGDFEQVLRESLRTYRINIVDNANVAPVTLNIISTTLTPTAGSVDSNLQNRQYTLTFTVVYNILSKSGKVIIPNNQVSSTTTFTSDMSQMMVSSKNATQQYMPGLYRDAVFRIVSQLLSNNSKHALATYFSTAKKK